MVNNATPPQQIVRYGRDEMTQHEDTGVGAVTVGNLVERVANGVQNHSTAAGQDGTTLIAIAHRGVGMEAGDAYDDGTNVKYLAVSGGGVWLRLAAGENVARGDQLVSAGDGTVRLLDTAGGDTAGGVVAEAEEALDNSGGTEAAFIRTEVTN